ncbi:MAG: MotA/TolQ/ExbB proton channel family protein [Bdellovibrionaceae bacterium]|nr:MotA/TolQ/ExbB proton channel family protein [Pseudobdellovibrionaceae bacterium]
MLQEKIFAVAHYADQVVLIILLFMSFVSIGMILERFFYLRKVANESSRVRERVRMALQTNSPEDFEDIARDLTSFEGKGAGLALRHLKESGSKGVEEIFNTYALTEKPELERFLGFLATTGSNAPYIGLFGTVLGIMKAFQDLASAPEAGQQTVMAGISAALIATAAGLFVAIPAVISFNYFSKKVRSVMQGLESVKELCLAYAKKKGL